MFGTEFKVFKSKRYPLLLQALYVQVAEEWHLPPPENLLKSLKSEVDLGRDEYNKLEVYYLENLLDESERDLFQVRFAYSKDARDKISLFLSIEKGLVQDLTANFPHRSGRGSFSRMLAVLKEICKEQHIDTREANFEFIGFSETGGIPIREHSLTAFVWIESIKRYLHVKEDPMKIRGFE